MVLYDFARVLYPGVSILQLNTWASEDDPAETILDFADGGVLSVIVSDCYPDGGTPDEDQGLQGVIDHTLQLLGDSIEPPEIPSSEEALDESKSRQRVMRATQLVLAGAVNSKIREDHIEVIQSLDEDTQESLMLCIQEIIVDSAETPQKEGTAQKNNEATPLSAQNEETPSKDTPDSRMTQGSPMSPGSRRRSSFGGTSLLDNEFDMITQECADSAEATKELEKLKQEKQQLEARLAKLQRKASEAESLRDEVDTLRPLVSRNHQAEEQIKRLKGKLEDMETLKTNISKLESRNNELVQQNLSLEEEIQKIPNLQSSLESARNAKCDAEMKISDLQNQLQEMSTNLEASNNQVSELQRQLQASESQAVYSSGTSAEEEEGSTTSVATGVSELNPELSEKLQRLQKENERLKQSLSGYDQEHITKLQDQVDDEARLKHQFESRYRETQAQMKQAQSELEQTKTSLEETLKQVQEKAAQVKQWKNRASQLEEQLREHKAIQSKLREKEQEVSEMHEQLRKYKREYQKVNSELTRLRRDAEGGTTHTGEIRVQLNQCLSDNQELQAENERLQEELRNAQLHNTRKGGVQTRQQKLQSSVDEIEDANYSMVHSTDHLLKRLRNEESQRRTFSTRCAEAVAEKEKLQTQCRQCEEELENSRVENQNLQLQLERLKRHIESKGFSLPQGVSEAEKGLCLSKAASKPQSFATSRGEISENDKEHDKDKENVPVNISIASEADDEFSQSASVLRKGIDSSSCVNINKPATARPSVSGKQMPRRSIYNRKKTKPLSTHTVGK
eukprot:gb/GECG01014016.1/.p1 GENE.gb/GECG01014016.1/~~gb/GECG01014016.1/.p1  ORF type:complete len:794 (+),score=165.09 gb/GECG01014016.1/:1-2382(+)